MKKILIGLTSTAAVFVAIAVFSQRHALACELLPVLNVRTVGDEIYLGKDVPDARATALKDIVDSAVNRITAVYGAPLSQPRYLITSDSRMAADWGANATASLHRMPWRSCIIVGPKGQSVDVVAHESLHAEIQHRVGFWRHLLEVPTWFDEGAALTVDYRGPFLPGNIRVSRGDIVGVKSLETGRDFYPGGRKNYQAARLAVEPLIKSGRFYEDLQRLADGVPFHTVFPSREYR